MQVVTSVGGGDTIGAKINYPNSNNIAGITVINPTDYVFYVRDNTGQNILTVGRGKGVSLPVYGDNDLILVSELNPVQATQGNTVCMVFASDSPIDLRVVKLS
jgi:hypothetical protein